MPSDLTIRNTPALKVTGLSGAATASRYVGSTTNGPPLSGAFLTGDWVIDQGRMMIWVCESGGSPGTWGSNSAWGNLGVDAIVTSDQTTITAVTDMPGASITATLRTDRMYRLRAHGFGAQSTVSTDTYQVNMMSGSTVITQARGNCNAPTNWACEAVVFAGSGASVVFKLQVQRVAGTGTLTHLAGATHPTILSLDDIGSAV